MPIAKPKGSIEPDECRVNGLKLPLGGRSNTLYWHALTVRSNILTIRATWDADRCLLEEHRFQVRALRERPSFVEAQVTLAGDSLLMQWARDSAYRFFPLVQHDELGIFIEYCVELFKESDLAPILAA